MARVEIAGQSVLINVEPGSGGSARPKRPVDTKFRGYDQDQLMLKLLTYGYSNTITSSRELERRCHHDVAFMF